MKSSRVRITILSLSQPLLEGAVRSDDSVLVRNCRVCLRPVQSQYGKLGLHAFRSQTSRQTVSTFQYNVESSRT